MKVQRKPSRFLTGVETINISTLVSSFSRLDRRFLWCAGLLSFWFPLPERLLRIIYLMPPDVYTVTEAL